MTQPECRFPRHLSSEELLKDRLSRRHVAQKQARERQLGMMMAVDRGDDRRAVDWRGIGSGLFWVAKSC